MIIGVTEIMMALVAIFDLIIAVLFLRIVSELKKN